MALTTDDPLAAQDPANDIQPSEYGGVPGLVQPEPHQPTASEQMMIMYCQDPLHLPDDPDYHDYPSEIGLPVGRTEWG